MKNSIRNYMETDESVSKEEVEDFLLTLAKNVGDAVAHAPELK